MIDLTPAAIGPYCVPVVNLAANVDRQNVNMVTCGGQATIPMVAASSRWQVFITPRLSLLSPVNLAELARVPISMSLRKPPPAIEVVGGAAKGKAIIVRTRPEPPLMMGDTVYVLSDAASQVEVEASINEMAVAVQAYVPGYRLKQRVQFEVIPQDKPVNFRASASSRTENRGVSGSRRRGALFTCLCGQPRITTSSALATAEKMAQSLARQAGEAA
ncbi:hypothetical protein ACLK2F_02090 [Escherichia coli]